MREAVQGANADATADEIVLPAGPVRVSRFGPSEDANATGDVDVQRDLTIRGAGPHSGPYFQRHQGDWEHVDILLDASLRPLAVYASEAQVRVATPLGQVDNLDKQSR